MGVRVVEVLDLLNEVGPLGYLLLAGGLAGWPLALSAAALAAVGGRRTALVAMVCSGSLALALLALGGLGWGLAWANVEEALRYASAEVQEPLRAMGRSQALKAWVMAGLAAAAPVGATAACAARALRPVGSVGLVAGSTWGLGGLLVMLALSGAVYGETQALQASATVAPEVREAVVNELRASSRFFSAALGMSGLLLALLGSAVLPFAPPAGQAVSEKPG